MFPEIFDISSYQLINFCASLVVIMYITINLKTIKSKKYAFYTALLCTLLGPIGSRLLWICYDVKNRANFESLFNLEYGSMDLGGAFLAVPLAVFLSHKLFKIEYKELLNVIIEALIIASAMAKIACFCAGCCSGIPTDVAWAVEAKYTNKLVHPVQLYETAIWIIIYIITILTKNRINNINRICLITIACIAMRMPVETLRRDAEFFIEGGYWLAYKILLAVATLILIINNSKKIKLWFNKVIKNDKSIK